MPVKKMKKPKKARAPRGSAAEKKKGLKQKQKQKQVVTVQVSSGGSGGGGYIPIPQAPEINYALLANLIKPANTVDVPIRAAAPVAEVPFMRPAEPPSLASESKSKRKYTRKEKVEIPVVEAFMTEDSSAFRPYSKQSAPFIATPAPSDFPSQSYFDASESGNESELDAQRSYDKFLAKKESSGGGNSSSSSTSRLFAPIDLRGVSKETRDRVTDFALNPEQEFLIKMGKLPSSKK